MSWSIKIGRRTWLRYFREDTISTMGWTLHVVHNRKSADRGVTRAYDGKENDFDYTTEDAAERKNRERPRPVLPDPSAPPRRVWTI